MIRIFAYSLRTKILALHEELPAGFSFRKNHIYWFDFESPTEEEVEILSRLFAFDPLSVEDALETDHFPKIEEFDTYLLILLRSIHRHPQTKRFYTSAVTFFLGSNFLVTVHHGPQPFLEKAVRRIRKINKLSDEGIMHFAHRLFSLHVDNLAPIQVQLEKKITKLENQILAGDSKDTIKQIIEYKREINDLIGVIKSQEEVFEEIVEEEITFINDEDIKYYQDVYEEFEHVADNIELARRKMNSVLDLHVSLNTDRLNEIIRVLTIVSGIMLPLSLVTGIYGTNFVNIPRLDNSNGFFEMLLLMALIAIGLLAYFKFKKWI